MPITDLAGLDIQPGPYPFTPKEPFPFEIYLFFIQSIRDADKADGEFLLLRWLEQMQEEWEETYARIYGLLGLYNVEETTSEALGHVKWLTGLSSALDFLTGGLSEAELRRLVSIAVHTWKAKGTEAGLIEALETVLVAEVRLDNWFRFRTLLYEWELGWADLPGVDPWLLDRPAVETSAKPDSVTWDGTALHFELTTLLESLEMTDPRLGEIPREVRVLCVQTRVTENAIRTASVEGDLFAYVTGPMGQTGTPSTNPDDYRVGLDLAEYTSDLRVQDNGGVVNRTLVEGLVSVLRPTLERYFVRYVTFLDSFRRDERWVVVSGAAEWDAEAGTVELYHATQDSVIRTDEIGDIAWTEYMVRAVLRLESHAVGLHGGFIFYSSSGVDGYALAVTPDVIGAYFSLATVSGGVPSVVAAVFLPVFHEGVDYTLSMDVEGEHIQCFLDGNLLLEVDDPTFSAGRVLLACAAGQRLTATYVEVAQKPIDSVRIGPPLSTG